MNSFKTAYHVLIVHLVLLCVSRMKADKEEEKCNCGQVQKDLIINGTDITDVYKYPWLVKPGVCSGVIISPTFVLSAAHCDQGEKPEDVHVVLVGGHGERRKTLKVKKITRHPKYDKDSGGVHDIALWQLEDKIECKPDSKPICLPSKELGDIGQAVVIAGFGQAEEPTTTTQNSNTENEKPGGKDRVQIQFIGFEKPQEEANSKTDEITRMKEGRAKIVTQEDCNQMPKGESKEAQYCVEGTDETSTCYGDSGSSMFLEKDGVFYTLAITSRVANGGCSKGGKHVFTSVWHYLDFIEENVKDIPKPPDDQSSDSTEEIDKLPEQEKIKKNFEDIKEIDEEKIKIMDKLIELISTNGPNENADKTETTEEAE